MKSTILNFQLSAIKLSVVGKYEVGFLFATKGYLLSTLAYKWLLVVRVHILLQNDHPKHKVSTDFCMFTFFRFNAKGMWKIPMFSNSYLYKR